MMGETGKASIITAEIAILAVDPLTTLTMAGTITEVNMLQIIINIEIAEIDLILWTKKSPISLLITAEKAEIPIPIISIMEITAKKNSQDIIIMDITIIIVPLAQKGTKNRTKKKRKKIIKGLLTRPPPNRTKRMAFIKVLKERMISIAKKRKK